jgi:hypothetical protein
MTHDQVPIDRASLARIPWVVVGLAALWLVIALPFFTDAACSLFVLMLLGCGGVFVGLLWIRMTIKKPSLLRAPARRWWLCVPLVAVLGFFLLVTDWGLALRVVLCERALTQYVASLPDDAAPDSTPCRVGLFWVNKTKVYRGDVHLYTSHSFLNEHGMAYIPTGIRSPAPRIRVKHLYGNWYRFEWKF